MKSPRKSGRFSNVNENLLRLAKSLAVVFIISVLLPLLFLTMNYDRNLIIIFTISNLLIWTDGFLTVHALRNGATEINPLMNGLNKITNRTRFLLISRGIGFLFTLYGIIEKNLNYLLVLTWIFAIVVCMNSITLSSSKFPK